MAEKLLRFPLINDSEVFLTAFWRWVGLLASGNNQEAVDSLFWKDSAADPEAWTLEMSHFFFGEEMPLFPVVPEDLELKKSFESLAEIEFDHIHTSDNAVKGWAMFTIPLSNKQGVSKGKVSLWGLPVSFFIREVEGKYAFEFESFHH